MNLAHDLAMLPTLSVAQLRQRRGFVASLGAGEVTSHAGWPECDYLGYMPLSAE